MSALTALEQALFNIAKGSLPSYLFQEDASAQEVLAAFAKQFAVLSADLSLLEQDTFITVARTEALSQHAKDRGTRRQEGESNEALSLRLRFLRDDTLTVAAIVARVLAILESDGVTIPAGYPGLIELRRDRLFWSRGDGVQITAVAAASIIDGETFTIDGRVFEFNKVGSVTSGNVEVDITAATTDDEVAAAIELALEGEYPGLAFSVNEFAAVRRAPGAISETVANGGFAIRRVNSYWSRGYRFTDTGRRATVVVIMLPFGTTAATQQSVAEAVRQIKAGGVKVIVERRLSP